MLSSFVIVLVSHAFLVQNRFYSTQTLRTAAQDNVRASTELMAREIRTAMEGGVVVAGARTLTVRSPIAVTILCAAPGSSRDVFQDGGETALDTDEVGGVAHLDPGTGDWIPVNATWSEINGSGSAAASCAANGADTVGGFGSFHRLANLNTLFSPSPGVGEAVMLFRETTFKIQPSLLDPTTLGIFRAAYGDSLVEFATGVDTTAQFQYRTVGSGYVDTVSAASLASVDAVRLVADARKPAPTGGAQDITFGWSVNVPIRLAR